MYKIIKRLLDIIFALITGCLIFLPLLPFIAIIIKLETSGPVFSKTQKVGKDVKLFFIYKFRTMFVLNDDEHKKYLEHLIYYPYIGQRAYADPRVTKVGKILRRLNLDSLPLLLNILKGDMSFIGPRPANVYEVEHYNDWEKERLKCRPGLTGLAQVNLIDELPDYDKRMEMDIEYVHNISFIMDLKILLKTIQS